ncbi:class I SAM-dependent methyltransferase [Mycobacterium marseillense]|uniref:class I SAM-dependent methyltransferase n=1 Tax=Mycobacterium marseillense TaxID=701042 RepID=UPI002591D9C9|nr:class I SAM-dependent methyltransferase [Mycobacterium marseillense]MDM3975291.1 class I SAM-dependent methyltransferase [Mycobacterium marseillense]
MQKTDTADYLFDYSGSEIERLKQQSEMLRPITERLLSSAGLTSGMRVLDIGCGAGDVTILAAELVGPRGRVIAIDRDATVINSARQRANDLGFSNVEFQQHDLETYDGPGGFDAVVCRYVLVHQPDPVRLLRAAKALVRAGGVVAVHEMDPTRGAQSNPRVPLLHRLETLILTAFSQMGTAINAGACLVKLFVDAGMSAPQMFAETIVESGEDSMLVPWFTATIRGVLPQLIASGTVSADEIALEGLTDQLRQAVLKCDSQIEFAPQMCAWTRV